MRTITAAAFLILLSVTTQAQTIFECGASDGHTYYFEGGYVSADKAGWQRDGMSDGQFSLIMRGEKLDVLFKDATGSLVSAEADGAQIFPLHIGDASATILLVYPGNVAEVYQFDGTTKTYSLSSIKFGDAPIRKAGTLVGTCR